MGTLVRNREREIKGGKVERCSVILASLPHLLLLIAGGGEKAGRLKRRRRELN